MKVSLKKAFLKDLEKLPRSAYQKVFHLVFNEIPKTDHIRSVKNVRKITVEKNYYRIRVGHYRIGFEYRGDELVFMRILHRKDIYRYFP